MNIQSEIARRDSELIERLNALGNQDIASLYSDIITLRKAAEVLQRSTPISEPLETPRQTKTVVATDSGSAAGQEGDVFSLRDAVRGQITEYGQRWFTTRQVLEALKIKYPNDVTDARLPSVSATLANLYTKKEVRKRKDKLNKTTFQSSLEE